MANKKNKRRSAARSSFTQAQAPAAAPVVEREPAPRPARQAPPAPQPKAAPRAAVPSYAALAEEYRYVIGDLKRIGVLAASMLVLLIVLAVAAQYVL